MKRYLPIHVHEALHRWTRSIWISTHGQLLLVPKLLLVYKLLLVQKLLLLHKLMLVYKLLLLMLRRRCSRPR